MSCERTLKKLNERKKHLILNKPEDWQIRLEEIETMERIIKNL